MKRSTGRKSTLWGIIKYEILKNGLLNAVWTNSTKTRNQLFNEIARKIGNQAGLEGRQ